MFQVWETRCILGLDCLGFTWMNLISCRKSQMQRIPLLKRLTKVIAGVILSLFLQPSLVAAFAQLVSKRVSFSAGLTKGLTTHV